MGVYISLYTHAKSPTYTMHSIFIYFPTIQNDQTAIFGACHGEIPGIVKAPWESYVHSMGSSAAPGEMLHLLRSSSLFALQLCHSLLQRLPKEESRA